MQQETGMYI